MEAIEIKVNHWGDTIEAIITQEEIFLGEIFQVQLNGNYSFTIYLNDEKEWEVMREKSGITPAVDSELLNKILKQLNRELKYAA